MVAVSSDAGYSVVLVLFAGKNCTVVIHHENMIFNHVASEIKNLLSTYTSCFFTTDCDQ